VSNNSISHFSADSTTWDMLRGRKALFPGGRG
jgi:hypothetical protein